MSASVDPGLSLLSKLITFFSVYILPPAGLFLLAPVSSFVITDRFSQDVALDKSPFMRVYVSIRACLCLCVYAPLCLCEYAPLCLYVCAYLYVYVYCVCVWGVFVSLCMWVSVYVCICVLVCECLCLCMCMCMFVCPICVRFYVSVNVCIYIVSSLENTFSCRCSTAISISHFLPSLIKLYSHISLYSHNLLCSHISFCSHISLFFHSSVPIFHYILTFYSILMFHSYLET